MATVTVQSLLNAATYDNYSVTPESDTVQDLKDQIVSADSVDADWFDLFFNNTVLSESATLSSVGIKEGSAIRIRNKIAKLATRQARQEAKLALAALDRAAYGSRPSTLDINQLPNPYNGNSVDPDDGASTLQPGRPWS